MSTKKKPRKAAKVGKPAAHSISIHENLSEALTSFLKKENLAGTETKEALASLVSLLSSYSEEGQRLFPEVLVFDDVSNILQTLPNSERVVIGSSPKTSATLGLALNHSHRGTKRAQQSAEQMAILPEIP